MTITVLLRHRVLRRPAHHPDQVTTWTHQSRNDDSDFQKINKRQRTPAEVMTTEGISSSVSPAVDTTGVSQQGHGGRRRLEEIREIDCKTLNIPSACNTCGPRKDFSDPTMREQATEVLPNTRTCFAGCELAVRGFLPNGGMNDIETSEHDGRESSGHISRCVCCMMCHWQMDHGQHLIFELTTGFTRCPLERVGVLSASLGVSVTRQGTACFVTNSDELVKMLDHRGGETKSRRT